MALQWIHESPAYWDERKAAIVGAAPRGTFGDRGYERLDRGEMVPGDWWEVRNDDATVGYGWMDVTWGDAEIGLAVDPEFQRQGIGTFILDHLEHEAAARGIHYLYNVVQATHPQQEEVSDWLKARNFSASEDGKLLRSVVRLSKASGE